MKRFSLICLLITTVMLLANCDYVGDDASLYPMLSEPNFNLLNGSDPLANYQFDFTATLTISSEGMELPVNITGDGAVVQHEDRLDPDMAYRMTFTSPANPGVSPTYELRFLEGGIYQRVTGVDDPCNDWCATTLGDFMGDTFQLPMTPGAVEPLDEPGMPDIIANYDQVEMSRYTSIEYIGERTVDGILVDHFLITLDFKEYLSNGLASDEMMSMLGAIGGVPTADPAETDAFLEAIDEFSITVNQYISKDTGLQARSDTDMRIVLTNAALSTDPAAAPSQSEAAETVINLEVETRYRDYYQPNDLSIEDTAVLAPAQPAATPPPSVGQPVQPAIQADINPVLIEESICNRECIGPIQYDIQLPSAAQEIVDLVILMDISSSMGEELDQVTVAIEDIVSQLQQEVPDLRVAVAVYSDHPLYDSDSNPSDISYQLVADFTTDTSTLSTNLANVFLLNGGRPRESTLYALQEVSDLNWRPGAIRLITLFTDAMPHNPDPGADVNIETSEDNITTDQLVSTLTNRGMHLIVIQSPLGETVEPSIVNYLENLATSTNGAHILLERAEDIPGLMIAVIQQFIGGDLRLIPSGQSFNFGLAGAPADWLTFTPLSFPYPAETGQVQTQMELCPYLGNLADGDYQLNLELRDTSQVYGNVNVNFHYDHLCADVYIADNVLDEGTSCSDVDNTTIFWQSSDIVIRNRDEGISGTMQTQEPIPGVPNYVYVRVHNRGPRAVSNAQLSVYVDENPFSIDFDMATPINSTQVSIEAGEEIWTGPFAWTPTSNDFAIRATVVTSEDRLSEENDIACDNNVAQLNLIYVTLDTASYGAGLLGTQFALDIVPPQNIAYSTLDLQVEADETLREDNGLLRIKLANDAFENWQERSGRITGGNISSTNEIILDTSDDGLLVVDDVVGGPNVLINTIIHLATGSNETGSLPLSLRAVDRTWVGATVIYRADQTVIPTGRASDPVEQPGIPEWREVGNLLPLVLFFGLITVFIFILVRRRSAA